VRDSAGPLFSIIIVCLDAEAHIAEALRSVVEQEHESYELVVVDGGSADGTIDIIRDFEARLGERMRWFSGPDSGLYDAMNKGLQIATGRYVVYLGADDRLVPGALDAVERSLRTHDWPEILAGAVRVVGAAREWTELPQSFASRRIPKRAPARHQSLVVNRCALVEASGFDTRYRIAADYDLYLRLLEAGAREALISEMLSEFRLGGISSRSASRTAREYRDVRVAHGGSRIVQHLLMAKSVAAATVVGAMRGSKRADRSAR